MYLGPSKSYLMDLQASGLKPYSKRDSGTGVFLWILQNFQEHLVFTEHLWMSASETINAQYPII